MLLLDTIIASVKIKFVAHVTNISKAREVFLLIFLFGEERMSKNAFKNCNSLSDANDFLSCSYVHIKFLRI